MLDSHEIPAPGGTSGEAAHADVSSGPPGSRPAPPDTRVKLFCLPCAGGSASAFRPLLTALRPEIKAVPVARDGRHREPSRRTFDEAVDDIVARITREAEDGPYAVYGHSLGGVLGYEAVRRLVRNGHRPPEHLFVSASMPPQRRDDHDGREPVHTYPDLAFLGALASTGGVPAVLLHDADTVEYFASRIRPDHEMLSRYRHVDPDRLLDCPVTVVTGTEDSATSCRDLDLWAALTTGPVTHLELAGAGHFFLDSHAEAVAARIHGTLLDKHAHPPAGPLGPEAFRDAMASLAAPVTVVTTWDAQGRARAFTASAVCSLSADPPLLLVCVNRSGRAHEVFRTADRFLVNVLGHEQSAVARDFARSDRADAEASLVPLELGLPGLPEASARFACTSRQMLPGGDHSVLTGRLEAVTLFDTPPLIHFRRDWHRPTSVPPDLTRGDVSVSSARRDGARPRPTTHEEQVT